MFTLDGKVITDLELIPKDCKLLLVSDKLEIEEDLDAQDGLEKAFVTGVDPKYIPSKSKDALNPIVHSLDKSTIASKHTELNKSQSNEYVPIIGLKNNIYQFENQYQVKNYKSSKIETSIINK